MHRLTKWLNKMVKAVVVLPILLATIKLYGQDKNYLSLQNVYTLAEQNYPAIRQKGLIKQTEDLALRNLATGYLPQLNITGQATYQSDVTRVDIPIPNIKVPS